jgi:hypothetical protein
MLPAGILKRSVNAETPNPRNACSNCLCRGLGVSPRFLSSVPKEGVAARAHRNISLHRRPRGVQRGEAPLRFSYIDPPRMGAKGVERQF